MSVDLFVFGTLCHAPLRALALGDDSEARVTPAHLPGYDAHWVAGADHPMLVARDGGGAGGLLLEGLDSKALARLDFFEGGYGYDLVDTMVEVDGSARPAKRYVAPEGADPGAPWDLAAWEATHARLWCHTAEEIMFYFGEIDRPELLHRLPMIRLRAASRLRAESPVPTTLRCDFDVDKDVEIVTPRRPYTNYFSVAEHDLRFRRFDGRMSETVNRAGFIGGDAVTVLPYDPRRDEVLLVEQFRIGPFMRGDLRPWMLEPVAGRVDPGEPVEETARREALEEAGLELEALHFVNGHYPSPGAVTEFVYAYVGIADLSGKNGTIAGLESEEENIRSHVIPFDRLMSLVESGEAGAGPLVVSAFWLALHRARLRSA